MILSYNVTLPNGQTIGISDDAAGDRRFEELYQEYGDCQVAVYAKADVFGVGFEGAKPLMNSTIVKLFA